MMKEEEKYEVFERYNADELTAKGKAAFEKLLNTDPVLAEEFELYQSASRAVEANFDLKTEDFVKNVKAIGAEFFDKQPTSDVVVETVEKPQEINQETKVVRLQPWMYVAVAIVAIIFGVYFFWQRAPHYSDYPMTETVRFTERRSNSGLFTKAEEAFNTKNYEEALVFFDKLLEKNSKNTQVHYYKGIALVETDQFFKADSILQELSEGRSIYLYKARWVHALSLLKQEHYEQCATVLKTIPEIAEDYDSAQQLLKKL